jgi:hypothetical protein
MLLRGHKTLRGMLVLVGTLLAPATWALEACPAAMQPLLEKEGAAVAERAALLEQIIAGVSERFTLEVPSGEMGFGARGQIQHPSRAEALRLISLIDKTEGGTVALLGVWKQAADEMPGRQLPEVLALVDTAVHRKVTPKEVLRDLESFTAELRLRAEPSMHLRSNAEAKLEFAERWAIYQNAAARGLDAQETTQELQAISEVLSEANHAQTISVWLLSPKAPLEAAKLIRSLQDGLKIERRAMGLAGAETLAENRLSYEEAFILSRYGARLKLDADGLITAFKRLDQSHGPDTRDVFKALEAAARALERQQSDEAVQI